MKQVKWYAAALLCVWMTTGCQNDDLAPTDSSVLVNSDFKTSTDNWTADFTDYSTAQDSIMEFAFTHAALPKPLDESKKALMISGHNRSDDMFMFVRRKITGLRPNTTYRLKFDVELASQYADNSVGIGGSPGSSVYLKAGATASEPKKVKKDDFYEISIDKGNQATGGKDAVVLGHVGAGADVKEYKLIRRTNTEPFVAKTNESGELWVIVGTDSGFEGKTTLYYNQIKVTVL